MTIEEAIAWFENWLLDYYDIDDMPQELTAELAGIALAALRQQEHFREDTKKVEPLTLDELRQMDGEPVWVEHYRGGEWIVVHWNIYGRITTAYNAELRYDEYGERWLAYRQKPEEDKQL